MAQGCGLIEPLIEPAPLFSAAGDAALDALVRRRTLYAFDFDGTLAPIVARPVDAVAPRETIVALQRLELRAPVAIVTGRAVADLRSRLGFDARRVVGNHGAEGMPDEANDGDLHAAEHEAVVERWTSQWPRVIAAVSDDKGILLESKGRSLSIHYRLSSDAARAKDAIDDAIARLSPQPRVIGGKFVVNLLPSGSADKGDALVRLARYDQCDAVFYIGDDATDEHAFMRAMPDWVTVRVGRGATAARYYVDEQADVARCVVALVDRIDRASPR